MKTLSSDALTALAAREVVIAGAAKFSFGTTYRLWSGIGDLTIDGETYTGVGASALITPIQSEVGAGADSVQLELGGLEPAIAATIDAEDYHQKPVTIYRLIFNAAGTTLLDESVFFRGRCDTVVLRETSAREATIEMSIVGGARDYSRRNARVRSNTDQRTLGGATDGGMARISIAGEKTLYWGGKPSTASQVVNGGAVSKPRNPRNMPFGG